MTRGRIVARVGRVKAVDIGQQHQHVGARHLRDAGGEAIIVAKADLGSGDRVVLVDDRHGAEAEQLGEGGAGIEMAASLLGVFQGQQDLRHRDAVASQRLLIGMRKTDLAGRRRGLLFLETQGATAQAEMAAPDRDRAGRDDDDLLPPSAAAREIIDQRVEPGAVDLAILADQEGRADLDDQPLGLGQGRG